MITISELYIYPVKSLSGIKLNHSELTPLGLKHDRRWMIVDENGNFLSQRTIAKMATIKTYINNDQLQLQYKNDSITIPKVDTSNLHREVSVWNDTFNAATISPKVDKWLSKILEQDCHLVYMHEHVARQINPESAPLGHNVSFADAYPILMISQASLNDLNNRLETPVNINRFRGNIIVAGCPAFAEDEWQAFAINHTQFNTVKKCSRCIMPSINQQTGVQDQLKMLAILNSYRKFNQKIKFGQNIRYTNPDQVAGMSISCTDEIKLIN
ncbi:MAG: MOSC domain-containing protein [Proteobacteria bacterium]|nr:MOSC domain-containing protein [Pseudomonadota bacterium]